MEQTFKTYLKGKGNGIMYKIYSIVSQLFDLINTFKERKTIPDFDIVFDTNCLSYIGRM